MNIVYSVYLPCLSEVNTSISIGAYRLPCTLVITLQSLLLQEKILLFFQSVQYSLSLYTVIAKGWASEPFITTPLQ